MALKQVRVTPTISTSAYASGDQLGDLMELSNILLTEADTVMLKSVVVLDQTGNTATIDLMFFNETPTIASSDNAAINVSDAEMEAKFLGTAQVANTDYADYNTNSAGTKTDIDLPLLGADTTQRNTSIFCQAVVRSTPTYAATDDLTFIFTVDQIRR